jgi:RNA-binding protein YlmH
MNRGNDREKFLSALDIDDKASLAKIFDKASLASKSGRSAFTSFLSEREYSVFLEREKYVSEIGHIAFGGYDGAGRVMLCFTDEEEEYFPISAVVIKGKGIEKLRHPDFLGSILSLGLERSVIGDIVTGDEECIVFAESSMASFIAESLKEVGGVFVSCREEAIGDVSVNPKFEEITGTVASLRADSVVSVMLKTSRTKAAEYIESQKFYLNQALCTKCDREIKENDILSVRRMGKARVTSTSGRSKKGRIYVTLSKYS